MKSDDQNDNFEVYGKLSKKYMEHSKLISFILNYILDHELVYERKLENEFTKEILDEIDMLKEKMKSLSALTLVVNQKFNTQFLLTQMKYQLNKLMLENFGSPSDDAYLFAQMAEEEAKDGGYFSSRVNNQNNFYQFIFLSKIMMDYSDYFLDMVIVDATYKRNRFNLPLVNVIGVNNFGHNIMLAFGLFSNETLDSYNWFSKN